MTNAQRSENTASAGNGKRRKSIATDRKPRGSPRKKEAARCGRRLRRGGSGFAAPPPTPRVLQADLRSGCLCLKALPGAEVQRAPRPVPACSAALDPAVARLATRGRDRRVSAIGSGPPCPLRVDQRLFFLFSEGNLVPLLLEVLRCSPRWEWSRSAPKLLPRPIGKPRAA